MLYQTNYRQNSQIERFDFLVICDRCWRPMVHVHTDQVKEIVRLEKEKENICLICRKKERNMA